jgi:hypothetical protein
MLDWFHMLEEEEELENISTGWGSDKGAYGSNVVEMKSQRTVGTSGTTQKKLFICSTDRSLVFAHSVDQCGFCREKEWLSRIIELLTMWFLNFIYTLSAYISNNDCLDVMTGHIRTLALPSCVLVFALSSCLPQLHQQDWRLCWSRGDVRRGGYVGLVDFLVPNQYTM